MDFWSGWADCKFHVGWLCKIEIAMYYVISPNPSLRHSTFLLAVQGNAPSVKIIALK